MTRLPAAVATPADDLSSAVAVASGNHVADARPQQFLAAFTAVATRASVRDLPAYVTAAVEARPELAAKIVGVAVASARRQMRGREEKLCGIIDQILAAAIGANPDQVVEIVRGTVEAYPTLRSCVLQTAVSMLPQHRRSIERALSQGSLLAGLIRPVGGEGSFTASSGTMSPANFSDIAGAVNSPEQPPPRR